MGINNIGFASQAIDDMALIESIMNEGESPNLKYYAFDWDDNILIMPTKIYVKNAQGEEKAFTTQEFAEVRNKLKDMGYSYFEGSFRDFRPSADEQFIKDSLTAKKAPAWNDFVQCVNSASVFAIITARGHSVEGLKKAVYALIKNNIGGISEKEVYESQAEYLKSTGKALRGNSDAYIQYYLNLCKFYPVSNPEIEEALGGEGGASSPEELKTKAMDEFIAYVKKIGGELTDIVDDVNGENVIEVEFSDDDKKNYETMDKHFQNKKEDGVKLKARFTGKAN